MQIEVNGKAVVLRDDVAVKDHEALYRKLREFGLETSWEERMAILPKLVESWGFDGNPQDPAAWEGLDVFDMMAIETGLDQLAITFTIRQHFPSKMFNNMRQLIFQLGEELSWRERAEKIAPFVESWTAAGEPSDIDAWGRLHVISLKVIERAVVKLLLDKMNLAKNLATRSTTP